MARQGMSLEQQWDELGESLETLLWKVKSLQKKRPVTWSVVSRASNAANEIGFHILVNTPIIGDIEMIDTPTTPRDQVMQD